MSQPVSNYRANFHLRKGGLHRALGMSEKKEIPDAKLDAALESKNGHVRKMAQFAKNAKKFKH